MLEPAAELIEDGPGARRIGGLGPHQADKLALARRAGRAADRTFDESGALGAHFLGERDLDAWPHRAHLDDELALEIAGEQPLRTAIDLVDRIRVGETGDDGLDRARDRRRARRRLGAGIDERLYLGGGAIPHRHLVANLDQPRRDRGAHPAEAGNSHAHVTTLRAQTDRIAATISENGDWENATLPVP